MKKYKIFAYLCTLTCFVAGCSSNPYYTDNTNISYGDILEVDESTEFIDFEPTTQNGSETVSKKETSTQEENTEYKTEKEPTGSSWSFYYEQLNDNEKGVYKNILDGCENFENTIKIKDISMDSLYRVWHAFNYDNPQFFWTSQFQYVTMFDKPIEIEFEIEDNFKDTFNKLNSMGDEIVSSIPENSTDYEKVKFLYEYIINTVDYVDNAPNDQDIRSALINKQSVCAGYSRAFQFLCQKAGIKCTYVSGTTDAGAHGWNLICLLDKYYWVDVTWGDPVYEDDTSWNKLNYDFLCVDDEIFLKSHNVDTGLVTTDSYIPDLFTYPNCTDKSYDYYYLENCYFDTYNRNVIYNIISEKILNDKKDINFRFKTLDEMLRAYNDIFTEDSFIFEVMENANKDWDTYSYIYTHNEKANTINIEITSK